MQEYTVRHANSCPEMQCRASLIIIRCSLLERVRVQERTRLKNRRPADANPLLRVITLSAIIFQLHARSYCSAWTILVLSISYSARCSPYARFASEKSGGLGLRATGFDRLQYSALFGRDALQKFRRKRKTVRVRTP